MENPILIKLKEGEDRVGREKESEVDSKLVFKIQKSRSRPFRHPIPKPGHEETNFYDNESKSYRANE